jgi:hypothetical protein
MNCFSSGREVSSRCKSVPSSSVTKYLFDDRMSVRRSKREIRRMPHMSSKGEMNTSLKLMIWGSTS